MVILVSSVYSLLQIIMSFSLNLLFLFEIMLITGGSWILDTNSSNSSIHIAIGALAVQVLFIILILSVLARHVNL